MNERGLEDWENKGFLIFLRKMLLFLKIVSKYCFPSKHRGKEICCPFSDKGKEIVAPILFDEKTSPLFSSSRKVSSLLF